MSELVAFLIGAAITPLFLWMWGDFERRHWECEHRNDERKRIARRLRSMGVKGMAMSFELTECVCR